MAMMRNNNTMIIITVVFVFTTLYSTTSKELMYYILVCKFLDHNTDGNVFMFCAFYTINIYDPTLDHVVATILFVL